MEKETIVLNPTKQSKIEAFLNIIPFGVLTETFSNFKSVSTYESKLIGFEFATGLFVSRFYKNNPHNIFKIKNLFTWFSAGSSGFNLFIYFLIHLLCSIGEWTVTATLPSATNEKQIQPPIFFIVNKINQTIGKK